MCFQGEEGTYFIKPAFNLFVSSFQLIAAKEKHVCHIVSLTDGLIGSEVFHFYTSTAAPVF